MLPSAIKNYVKNMRDISKPTFLICGVYHSPEQCKSLNDFGTGYAASRPFAKHRWEPLSGNNYKKNQEVNAIVQNSVDDILQEDKDTRFKK